MNENTGKLHDLFNDVHDKGLMPSAPKSLEDYIEEWLANPIESPVTLMRCILIALRADAREEQEIRMIRATVVHPIAGHPKAYVFDTPLQEEVEGAMLALDYGCEDYSLSFVKVRNEEE